MLIWYHCDTISRFHWIRFAGIIIRPCNYNSHWWFTDYLPRLTPFCVNHSEIHFLFSIIVVFWFRFLLNKWKVTDASRSRQILVLVIWKDWCISPEAYEARHVHKWPNSITNLLQAMLFGSCSLHYMTVTMLLGSLCIHFHTCPFGLLRLH